jgi:NAD(P)-dependent dehydrogenase (short-subunit alcohol dehydrogenase family)
MASNNHPKSVFLVGAGFIGLNIIEILVKAGYHVSALTRRKEHAAEIEAMGASTIIGTLEDADLIAAQAARSNVVIHTATADHIPSALAILKGVQQRADKGQDTIYIHNSGTGVLNDGAAGQFKAEKIFKDDTRDDVDSVPDNNPHREVDLAIVAKQKEIGSGAKVAIMIPPLIYGCKSSRTHISPSSPLASQR